ncbi:MAG: 16S rRNA (guanine(527)-N(7))-methyltransferase RsmG [Cyclonatronaceae bacterium]
MNIDIRPKRISGEALEYVNSLIEAYEKPLSAYAERLLWWNGRLNLLSRNADLKSIEKHIVHSLLLATASGFTKEQRLIDIGSGGGLPGIPLAICFPEKQFILLDRVAKKCAAMQDMAAFLKLRNTAVEAKDLKMFHVKHQDFSWMSKHAIKLNEFLRLTQDKPGNCAYFLKGDDYKAELASVPEGNIELYDYDIADAVPDDFYTGKRILVLYKS